ncbi:MAG: sugar phosphate isomerase/epimerase [Propionibacteriales bacterium]|nr:sugar phosphate isomerase/epimerase [Propionibacteriales bacterium]
MTTLAVQLYSVRDALTSDAPGTLATLAEMGYTHVEPYGVEEWVEPLAEAFSANGLAARSTHANPIDGDREAIFAACRRLGVTRLIQPSSPREMWTDAAAVSDFAGRMNELAVEAAAAGLELGYHNHEFEIESRLDGRVGLEFFVDQLDPSIQLQVDTYWAHVGGADVPALLGALGDRVTSIHIKDGDGTRDTKTQVAVGAGSVPVLDFIDAATAIDTGIVELDDTALDMLTQVRDSRTFLINERTWA